MKTCLFRRDGYSLQGYQGAFRHEHAVSSIVKPQSPRGALPSGGAWSQSAAFEKPQLPSERTPMLSKCQCSQSAAGNERLKNTVVCQGEGQQWSLFSFCLGFCFVCVSVVSAFFFFFFCLRLMLHDWQLVATSWGTWSLPTVGLLSSWVPCHLGSCHPGEGDTPCWSTYCLAGPMMPETHSLTGWITVRVTTFVDPSNPSWQ